MDAGEETIADRTLAGRLREKAATVHRRSLLLAFATTILVLAFP